ncbi:MAG: hypothetical protein V3U72_02220 [Candidatus Aenigmarchaeota archaeon]
MAVKSFFGGYRSEIPVYAQVLEALNPSVAKISGMIGRQDGRYTKIEPGGKVRFGFKRRPLNRQGENGKDLPDMEMKIRNLHNGDPKLIEVTGSADNGETERSSKLPFQYSPSSADGETVQFFIPRGYKWMNEFILENTGKSIVEVDCVEAYDSIDPIRNKAGDKHTEIPDNSTEGEDVFRFPSQVFGCPNKFVDNPDDSTGKVDGVFTRIKYRGGITYFWDKAFGNGPGHDLKIYGKGLTGGTHSYGVFAWGLDKDGKPARVFLGRGGTPPEGQKYISFDLGPLREANMIEIDLLDEGMTGQRNFEAHSGELPILGIDALEAVHPGGGLYPIDF